MRLVDVDDIMTNVLEDNGDVVGRIYREHGSWRINDFPYPTKWDAAEALFARPRFYLIKKGDLYWTHGKWEKELTRDALKSFSEKRNGQEIADMLGGKLFRVILILEEIL